MASTSLRRQVSVTGNRQIFTISAWVKKTKNADTQNIFSQYIGSGSATTSTHFRVRFSTSDNLQVSAGATDFLITNRLFRDTSSFYQVVVAVNTTLATADDRVKLYINGVQETSFATRNNPSQNLETVVNNSGSSQYPRVGADDSDGNGPYGFFDGVMSQVILIDGTAYAASTFGSTNSVSGEWTPNSSPSVTYGTNGFKLTFEDTSALGDDTSGNTNDLTVLGTGTSTKDCASNNFATWNPLNYVQANNSPVLTNGNTKMNGTNDPPYPNAISTLGIPKSGKYYAEFKNAGTQSFAIGICDIPKGMEALRTASTTIYNTTFNGAVSLKNDGSVIRNGTETNSVTPTIAQNDIVMIAYDADNGAFYAGRNGTWGTVGGVVGVPTSGSSKTGAIDISAQSWFTTSTYQGFLVGSTSSGGYAIVEANFGNGYFGTTAVTSAGTGASTPGTFEYAVPTSYQPLSTKGLNV